MKDKTTAGVLALLLGGIGGHKFYLGQTGAGIVYLLFCWTLIPGLIAFIEGIQLLTMNQATFDMRHNGVMLPPQGYLALAAPQPQNIVVNVAPPAGAAATGQDVGAQLKTLHELKLAGALTDEEFAAQKKKLLGI